MNDKDIIYQRLYNQNISHHPFNFPEEVVHWMGAMQAQDYLSSLLAIGLRTGCKTAKEATIEEALSSRKIVRTWPMRGTLHFVAATDVRWMLRLLTPRVIKSSAGRYRQLELDDAVFNKSRKTIEDVLQGGVQQTRQEIYAVLENAGISTAGQRGIHILNHLAQKEVICFGPRKGKHHTFTLLDEWLTPGGDLDSEIALATLADRYFKSHGPATVHDFSAWAGLRVTDARKGIEHVKSNFEQTTIDGTTYWFPEPIKDPDFKAPQKQTRLLPAFDEMLCGYKDRSALIPSANLKSTILKNGMISAVIVVNGKAAGTWRRIYKKEKVVFELHFFHPPSKSINQQLEHKAIEIASFLGKPYQINYNML